MRPRSVDRGPPVPRKPSTSATQSPRSHRQRSAGPARAVDVARQDLARFQESLLDLPTVQLGGLPITVIDRQMPRGLMIASARGHSATPAPIISPPPMATSSRRRSRMWKSPSCFAKPTRSSPTASRWFSPHACCAACICRSGSPPPTSSMMWPSSPNRKARRSTCSGSTEAENNKAVARVRAKYPRLRIAGNCHGFLAGQALERKLDEINALAPDILWLGLGVPREQIFVRDFASRLHNVGVIKTSGGLFDHIAGKVRRAPAMGAEGRLRVALARADGAAPAFLALFHHQSPGHLRHIEVFQMTAEHPHSPLPDGTDAEIAIVGAGLSGTIAANVLARAGYQRHR